MLTASHSSGQDWITGTKIADTWEKLPDSKPFFVVSKEPTAGYTICPLTNVPLVTFKPPTDLVKDADGFYTWVLPLMYRCANACGRRKGVPLLQSIHLISDDVVRDKLIDPFKFTLKVCERPKRDKDHDEKQEHKGNAATFTRDRGDKSYRKLVKAREKQSLIGRAPRLMHSAASTGSYAGSAGAAIRGGSSSSAGSAGGGGGSGRTGSSEGRYVGGKRGSHGGRYSMSAYDRGGGAGSSVGSGSSSLTVSSRSHEAVVQWIPIRGHENFTLMVQLRVGADIHLS